MAQPRVSIVTGAARGIGFGVAQRLERCGDRLVLADVSFQHASVRDEAGAKLTSEAILSGADICRVDEVAGLVEDALSRFGSIGALVNCAAVNRPSPIQDMTDENWDTTLAVNLRGAFVLSRAVAGPMMAQGSGRIVHIASTAAFTAAAGLSAYAASKHGLVGLTRAAACDLGRFGITVNAVCPGNTDTQMLRDVLEERGRLQGRTCEEVLDDIVRKTPAGRLGTPDDVAAAVLFLLSDEAQYITGQTLTVDGGRSLNLV